VVPEIFQFNSFFNIPSYLLQIATFHCSFSRTGTSTRPLRPCQFTGRSEDALRRYRTCLQFSLFSTYINIVSYLPNHSSVSLQTWHVALRHCSDPTCQVSDESVQSFTRCKTRVHKSVEHTNKLCKYLANRRTNLPRAQTTTTCHHLLPPRQTSGDLALPFRCYTPFSQLQKLSILTKCGRYLANHLSDSSGLRRQGTSLYLLPAPSLAND